MHEFLHAILEEEKRADEKLSQLAEQGVNREALSASPGNLVGARAGRPVSITTMPRATCKPAAARSRITWKSSPLPRCLIAGATGYLLAYLVHGDHRSWRAEPLPDYARRRSYERQVSH